MKDLEGGHQWTVLVTGAALDQAAAELLAAKGAKVVNIDGYAGKDALVAAARDHQVDALLVRQGKIDADVIAASDRLRVIAKHGSGVDNIDLAAASAKGIPVLRALSANAQSVAELAISLTVTLLKDIPGLHHAVTAGGWPKAGYVGRDLAGAVFGVVGFGDIGRRAARLAQALGMQTMAFDPVMDEGLCEGTVVTRDLDRLLRESDVVSLHCPLTSKTRGLIGARELGLIGTRGFIVNTARGGIIDEDALDGALRSGAIAGAALDSFAQEPPPKDLPLLQAPYLIATPHIAGASRSALRNMAMQSATGILNYLQDQVLDQATLANAELSA
ncbi:hydroxyacid dehydrogenase [Ketogulonicigenium vulgare]|uniref:hydroxyacid dehydrogenase n=1 Tax=Ketogulonicigenium vulgare TaxID=92945 RepID=UPI002359F118|nr:hydroxyacid dehydrogenase [Ketogulonicigenium vulgare]